MKLLIFVILVIIAGAIQVNAFISGERIWVKRYHPTTIDSAKDMAIDKKNNVYVTGVSGTDYVTIKYDSSGNRKWARRYEGVADDNDSPSRIAIDSASNVYITAKNASYRDKPDYTIVKYDKYGNKKWVRQYNGPVNEYDEISDIAVDRKGNVFVTGYSDGLDYSFDIATVKYDSFGNRKWVRRFDSKARDHDWGYYIAVDSEGNAYVAGGSFSDEKLGDIVVIKYDAAGNRKWLRRYNGSGNEWDEPTGIEIDNSNNIYIVGTSYGGSTGNDFVTIKYDSAGNRKWLKRFNGPDNDYDSASGIDVDNDGNVYVAGTIHSDQAFDDFMTIKYDTDGQVRWESRYDGSVIDFATSIAVDAKGNVYVAGASRDNSYQTDYTTVKYDSNGNRKWVKRYNTLAKKDDVVRAIAIDSNGYVYVTGESYGLKTLNDYSTIKYAP